MIEAKLSLTIVIIFIDIGIYRTYYNKKSNSENIQADNNNIGNYNTRIDDTGNYNTNIDNNGNDNNIDNYNNIDYIGNNFINDDNVVRDDIDFTFKDNIIFRKNISKINNTALNKRIKENIREKKVPIAFSVDNNYIYPLIVLLTSIYCNSSPKTFYSFHLLTPSNFLKENKAKLKGLAKKYPKPKSEFIYHDMGDKYLYWNIYGNYTQTVYYRLSLSEVILDYNKIIYLDCDTMVHKDLSEFYNIEMDDYYYMGFPGHEVGYMEFNGTRNFINSGVMLINLEKLRELNVPQIYESFYNQYGTKKVDEYMINAIFFDKIRFLPFIYGIPDFEPHDIIGSPSIFWNSLKGYSNGTEKEMISANINRTITHGAYKDIKWWSREYNNLTHIGKKWIFYASKSNVFDEICNLYKQYKKICHKFKRNTKKDKNY